MKMSVIVACLLALVLVMTGVYDLYASYVNPNLETVSEFVWRTSSTYPILPFIAGVVAGHLFWRK